MKTDYQDDSSFSSWYPDKPALRAGQDTHGYEKDLHVIDKELLLVAPWGWLRHMFWTSGTYGPWMSTPTQKLQGFIMLQLRPPKRNASIYNKNLDSGVISLLLVPSSVLAIVNGQHIQTLS